MVEVVALAPLAGLLLSLAGGVCAKRFQFPVAPLVRSFARQPAVLLVYACVVRSLFARFGSARLDSVWFESRLGSALLAGAQTHRAKGSSSTSAHN